MNLDKEREAKEFSQLSDKEKENYFLKIYNQIGTGNLLNMYFTDLPPHLKIKYLDLFDFNTYYNKEEILYGIKDEQIIYKILLKMLEHEKYGENYIFKLVPNNYKEKFLSEIKKKEELTKKEIINQYNIDDYLKSFKEEDRYHILVNIIFKDFLYKYENGKYRYNHENDYAKILNCFPNDNKEFKSSSIFKVLDYLVNIIKQKPNEYGKNDHERIYYVKPITDIIYKNGYNIKEALKYLMDSDVLVNTSLSGTIEDLPDEIKKEVAEFIIEYYKEKKEKLGNYAFYSLINNLKDEDLKELFSKYVLKEQIYDYSYVIGINSFKEKHNCLYYCNLLFELLSEEQLEEYFENINISLTANPKLPTFEQGHDLIIKIYSKRYKVNYEGLKLFINKFGYQTLKYIDNENLKKIINMDINYINKLFELFNDNNYYFDKNIKNDILNSLIQRKFMIENKDIYNIFGTFEKLVKNQDINSIDILLKKISESVDINDLLTKEQITYNEFLNQILNGNLDVLHKITSKFIAYNRELYLQEKIKNIDDKLELDKIISKDEYKKKELKEGYYHIAFNLKQLDKNKLTNEEKLLINNRELLDSLIKFKNDPINNNLNPEEKRYLKILNSLLEKLYKEKINFSTYNPTLERNQDLQYDLVQKKVNIELFLEVLLEAKYEGVICLLENEELYQKLNNFFQKYKILGWQNTFTKLMEECDINFNENTLASFFSNFDKFVDKVNSSETLTSIIDYANCYSSVSSIYSLLFGKEDYNYIASNPGKNKSSLPKHKRLKECTSLINEMYNKKFLTLQPIDREFTIHNNKSINVNLGNFTNMINLTYGERTEACMRKGGAFNDLYEACLNNENCFHIRFTNPKTGKFVSRVSGLRNGNTIFLNELRNSLDEDYDNEDLYNFIKDVANYLVQTSKNTSNPIDNVIITSDYALSSHTKENQNISLTNKELIRALYGLSFNLSTEAIILATSNFDQSLVDYKFNTPLSKYDSLRDNIATYKGKEAKERMIQLHLINGLLNGLSLDEIDINKNIEIPSLLISGEDYYISVNDNQLELYVLDKFQNNPKTLEEIDNIMSQYGIEKGSVKK